MNGAALTITCWNPGCFGVFHTRARTVGMLRSSLQGRIHGVPRIEYSGADSPKQVPLGAVIASTSDSRAVATLASERRCDEQTQVARVR